MGTYGGTPAKPDLAVAESTATLGALNAVTAGVPVTGFVNLSVLVPSAFVGTVIAERSFDSGSNWLPVSDAFAFSGNGSLVQLEPEAGILWRLRCSAYTSGSCVGRVSL